MRDVLAKYFALAAIVAALYSGGCRGSHQDVVDERNEARKEISNAEANVRNVEQRESEKINAAAAKGASADAAERKVDATEEIAKAEKKVDDEKVEATKEITQAEHDAGEAHGSYRKE